MAVSDQTELFVALVAAVGTDLHMVCDQLATQLDEYGYTTDVIRLSDFLAERAGSTFRGKPFDEELWEAMTAGDELRRSWDRNDALALHAISAIVATREARSRSSPAGAAGGEAPYMERHAFVLRSLKTPDELDTLRAVYGPRLVVVGAYSPRELRVEHLARQIEDSRNSSDRATWAYQPDELIERDEREERVGGQDVGGTFHRADFFIHGWSREVVDEDVRRTLEILFGAPFRTPTRDEHGQFHAAGAALRSAEFGRQVGAAIATPDGSVIALGTNEVPKAQGGSHWEEEGLGNRDFEIGDIDTNRRHFDELARRLSDLVDEQLAAHIETFDGAPATRDALESVREQVRSGLPGDLMAGGLKDLTEFGRAVHAEMNALLDAARRGVSVAGSTMYTTTFPCHNCARHIIGAGVRRVVFVEPYAKSRAGDLHEDSILIDAPVVDDDRVSFEPFVGVAPRRYAEMFDAATRERLGHLPRRDTAGHKLPFLKRKAVPVFSDAGLPQFRPALREYRVKETLALAHFAEHRATA